MNPVGIVLCAILGGHSRGKDGICARCLKRVPIPLCKCPPGVCWDRQGRSFGKPTICHAELARDDREDA